MCKMTIVHLGVIFYTICLSAQVFSQNTTGPSTGMNYTYNSSMPTMATDTFSSTNSTSSPTGAGLSLHTFAISSSALFPLLVTVAPFLQSLS